MAQFQFDASQVAPDTGIMDPVPAGWYVVMATKSEIKPTKAGNGDCFLEFQYDIQDGQFKGRKVFDRFNIRNSNPQAQEIGYRQLSALAHATGVMQFADSAQLHNIPFKVKVKVRAGDGQYEATNEVTARKHISENTAGAPVAAAAPAGMPPAQVPPLQTPVQAGWGAPVQAPAQQAPVAQPWAQQPQQQAPVAQQAPQGWQQPQAPAMAPQQPVQPPVQQPPANVPPVQAAAQPWAQAPAQPWGQPGAAAPVQQHVAQQPQQAPVQYAQQSAVPPWAQQPAPAAA